MLLNKHILPTAKTFNGCQCSVVSVQGKVTYRFLHRNVCLPGSTTDCGTLQYCLRSCNDHYRPIYIPYLCQGYLLRFFLYLNQLLFQLCLLYLFIVGSSYLFSSQIYMCFKITYEIPYREEQS